uniref:C-type lectin domain-containing protein n=1 Tax=Sinocyclocheilus grahami TaxID=75366 RepID=A0A672NXJ6_SINGR
MNLTSCLWYSGSYHVRMRSSRAFTVGLVMLCVLLLTAVVVLGVKFNKNYTEETNQLLNKEERACLSNNYGWVCYQSSLYFISSEMKNWEESRTYCRNEGADLIIINNSEKQVSEIRAEEESNLSNSTELLMLICCFRFWRSKEPNGYTKENCVLAYASGWIDHGCHKEFKWICEKNI